MTSYAALASRPPRRDWPLRRLDPVLALAVAGLVAMGSLLVWSATRQRMIDADLDPQAFLKRHLVNAAIGVVVETAFVHCAKSFRRGQVWEPESWTPDAAPSAAELLTCHIQLQVTPDKLAADLEAGYAHDLAAERAARV